MLPEMQAGQDDELTPTTTASAPTSTGSSTSSSTCPCASRESSSSARRRAAWPLGPIIFVVCEFQVIDRETEAANEQGEASHAKYKERQKRAVMRRLQLGMREPIITLRDDREQTPEPPPTSAKKPPSRRPPSLQKPAIKPRTPDK